MGAVHIGTGDFPTPDFAAQIFRVDPLSIKTLTGAKVAFLPPLRVRFLCRGFGSKSERWCRQLPSADRYAPNVSSSKQMNWIKISGRSCLRATRMATSAAASSG